MRIVIYPIDYTSSHNDFILLKMVINIFLLLLGLLAGCHGEMMTAFYVPEDKLSLHPNVPNMTKNGDLYHGFTLKERFFKGKEYEEVLILLF